jgi:molybdate transport system regulatory protein
VRISARNQLRGKVSSVTLGAVNAEVSLALDDATTVTAIITNESVGTLGLAQGQAAVAVFKASSVILGVAD